jgi:hypothetical protein
MTHNDAAHSADYDPLSEIPHDWEPTREDKLNAVRCLRRVASNGKRRQGTRWVLLALAQVIEDDAVIASDGSTP